MAASRYPTNQYLAGDFVISAGCILFRRHPISGSLEICVLHHLTKDEWLLPKGRKDQGETTEKTAVRETYEETGYACDLWPQRMPTRAPTPGVNNVHSVEEVEGLVEPIAVTIRHLKKDNTKLIFWYIALAREGVAKVEGTQMENENFESVFMDAKAAAERLTFESDRDIILKALQIVES